MQTTPATSIGTDAGSSSAPAMPDALALLKQDHEKVEQLFAQCEQQRSGASDERGDVVHHICRELTVHAQIEEQVFYPALREAGVESSLLDEATQEHAEVKLMIAQLQGASGDAVTQPLQRLMEAVRHHVQEEESQMFPAARTCGVDLGELGQRLAQCKQNVKPQVEQQMMQQQSQSPSQNTGESQRPMQG